MNPSLVITVDAKNRALSVASGMITVGAKIDASISGLPADIPDWGAGDRFTGRSVRFRLVDGQGRDLARYPLTDGDSWVESEGVYRTTNAIEFDTDALRRAFDGVAFNDWLELGVIVDSVVDDAQYAVGNIKVRQWAVAQTEDPTVLPDWRETLAKLKDDLSDVEAKKSAAEAANTAAAESAAAAELSSASAIANATAAANSASDSAASASSASVAATNAASAKSAAEAANTAAEAARDRAEAAADNAVDTLASAITHTAQTLTDAQKTQARQNIGAASAADVSAHAARTDNPHSVTKGQVGLGNVDNTADMDKPVSIQQKAALDAKQDKLTDAQAKAVNSGISSEKVAQIEAAVGGCVAKEAFGAFDGIAAPSAALSSLKGAVAGILAILKGLKS